MEIFIHSWFCARPSLRNGGRKLALDHLGRLPHQRWFKDKARWLNGGGYPKKVALQFADEIGNPPICQNLRFSKIQS
jgi:hypothetical protein